MIQDPKYYTQNVHTKHGISSSRLTKYLPRILDTLTCDPSGGYYDSVGYVPSMYQGPATRSSSLREQKNAETLDCMRSDVRQPIDVAV